MTGHRKPASATSGPHAESDARSPDWDAIVVGLGGIGSAAAYQLARRGGRVLGLEQFELGHVRGASQDVSRIIRLSYHHPDYVGLARHAYAAWDDLEREASTRIVTRTGGLDFEPPDAVESLDDYAASLRACEVPFELLDAVDVDRRWPQWRLDGSTRALFQADAGIADPSRGNAAHQRLAREHGATLLERTTVTVIRDVAGEVVVETATGAFTAGAVVVAADAWTNALLEPLDAALPLRVTREQVTWYEPLDDQAFAPERFPIWIWLGAPSFYGFPAYHEPGPKIGEDVGGSETTADGRSFEPDPGGLARTRAFLERHLPSAAGRQLLTKTCLYTLTPDRDFVLDRVPGHPGIVVALGAAHAYKFAAVFGRLLADLALDGRPSLDVDLARFALDRPALRATSAPTARLAPAERSRIEPDRPVVA